MSTQNLCFRAKIRKKCIPCTPKFYYIEVGCKGVFITRTCLHDGTGAIKTHIERIRITTTLEYGQ